MRCQCQIMYSLDHQHKRQLITHLKAGRPFLVPPSTLAWCRRLARPDGHKREGCYRQGKEIRCTEDRTMYVFGKWGQEDALLFFQLALLTELSSLFPSEGHFTAYHTEPTTHNLAQKDTSFPQTSPWEVLLIIVCIIEVILPNGVKALRHRSREPMPGKASLA